MKEVVIQMSDGMFERIMKAQSVPDMYGADIVNAMNCIKSGTVLPEGHGDLIDRGNLAYYRCPNNVNNCPTSYDFTCNSCDYGIIHKFQVDRADAVIPADREKE